MSSEINHFEKLSKINVNDKTETKQRFTYLSWAYAVGELMKQDPKATWQFHEPKNFNDTLMVSCTLTAFDKPIYMWLPVMDNRNQAIKNPDAFAVNKAMMRCLVKAIAAHGLGLYIYAGEDLPSDDDASQQVQTLDNDRFKKAIAAVQAGRFDKAQLLDENKYALTKAQRIEVMAA